MIMIVLNQPSSKPFDVIISLMDETAESILLLLMFEVLFFDITLSVSLKEEMITEVKELSLLVYQLMRCQHHSL